MSVIEPEKSPGPRGDGPGCDTPGRHPASGQSACLKVFEALCQADQAAGTGSESRLQAVPASDRLKPGLPTDLFQHALRTSLYFMHTRCGVCGSFDRPRPGDYFAGSAAGAMSGTTLVAGSRPVRRAIFFSRFFFVAR